MGITLDGTRSSALFDILSHYDTYAEIRDFRYPGAFKHYGPPFELQDGTPSTSPALQTLVSKLLATLPGLRNVSEDFWKVKVEEIIEHFAQANLSESYDKGTIGLRKTLATAMSALIEYPVRGTFGGFAQIDDSNQQYDLTSAEDLARSFEHFMNGCVYGTALEDMAKTGAETDNLDAHSNLVKAFHEVVLVNLASFIHFTLVLSPKGQYLLKLIESANKLIPYMLIRQTLKISNVATMINAMVKIVLAKMSVTGVTNWIGLTKSKDDGMNLLQYIITTVLYLDIRELEGRATKIKRDPANLSKDQLQTLKDYALKAQAEQAKLRQQSYDESIPIVTTILRSSSIPHDLTDFQQSQALEYLSLNLAVRDRREIIRCLCHTYPDRLTTAVRQVVDAYDSNIRNLHNAVNLSDSLGDLEAFIQDIIKVAKIQVDRRGESTVPTVADFVAVNRKHQYSLHKFLHQICKNGPEIISLYMAWAKKAASLFRPDTIVSTPTDVDPNADSSAGAGASNLSRQLNDLFNTLDSASQQEILPILDQHARYIGAMHADSLGRLQKVIKCPPSKNPAIAKVLSSSPSSSSAPSPPHTTTTTTTSSSPTPTSNSGSRVPSPAPAGPALTSGSRSSTGTSTSTSTGTGMGMGTFSLSRLQQYLKGGDTSGTTTPTKTNSSPSPNPNPSPDADRGPGTFLARWQDLLDQTHLTTATSTSSPSSSSSSSAFNKNGENGVRPQVDVEEEKGEEEAAAAAAADKKAGEKNGVLVSDGSGTGTSTRPDVTIVQEKLGPGFRKILAEKSLCW